MERKITLQATIAEDGTLKIELPEGVLIDRVTLLETATLALGQELMFQVKAVPANQIETGEG